MLFFRSEVHAARWCEENKVELKPMISIDQLWRLAEIWYANRLTVDSRRPAPDEMVQVFSSLGLTGPFWDLKADHWTS